MNVALQASRKEYWAKVHKIQSEQGVDVATAKQLYKSNGSHKPTVSMTIDEIVSLASEKVDEIQGELTALSQRISDLQNELARWCKLRDLDYALNPPLP